MSCHERHQMRAAVLLLAICLQAFAPVLMARAQAAQAQLCFTQTDKDGKPKPGAHALPCLHADRRNGPRALRCLAL
jgi:hypothetical protein